jgi:hypothetical protein
MLCADWRLSGVCPAPPNDRLLHRHYDNLCQSAAVFWAEIAFQAAVMSAIEWLQCIVTQYATFQAMIVLTRLELWQSPPGRHKQL